MQFTFIPDLPRFAVRLLTKANSLWLRYTFPFVEFGPGTSIHHSCDISKRAASGISIGNNVYLAEGVWLNVVQPQTTGRPKIVLGDRCKIGRRSTVSAETEIEVQEDVLLAPGVLLMDHNHNFSDPERPIHLQGVTTGGRIVIERNCWIGYGALVLSGAGELVIGRNSVVAAHAVVTKSVPPCTVVAGVPARVVKEVHSRPDHGIAGPAC